MEKVEEGDQAAQFGAIAAALDGMPTGDTDDTINQIARTKPAIVGALLKHGNITRPWAAKILLQLVSEERRLLMEVLEVRNDTGSRSSPEGLIWGGCANVLGAALI